MIQYFYTNDYTVEPSGEGLGGATMPATEAVLFHSNMAILADRFMVTGLKLNAWEKFFNISGRMKSAIDIIRVVPQVCALPAPPGQPMRVYLAKALLVRIQKSDYTAEIRDGLFAISAQCPEFFALVFDKLCRDGFTLQHKCSKCSWSSAACVPLTCPSCSSRVSLP